MEKENLKTYLRYSPKMYMFENPPVHVYELKEINTGENVYTFVLDYKEDGKINQIVLGTVDKTEEFKEDLEKIKNYMSKQIEQNAEGNSEFYTLERFIAEMNNKNIPFKFTIEGKEVLLQDSIKERVLTKTFSVIEDKTGKIDALQRNFDIESIKEHSKHIPDIRKSIKWARRRNMLLKKFSPEEKELFIKGENISNFVKERNLDVILGERKGITVDYLMQNYPIYDDKKQLDENEGSICDKYLCSKERGVILDEQAKEDQEIEKNVSLSEKYLETKEKGLAIDAKIILEKLENKLFEKFSETGQVNKRTMSTIQNYEKFFELLKTKRDFNARYLALEYKKIDFNVLKECFSKFCVDREINAYIDKKVRYIEDVQLKRKIEPNDYDKNESVADLYQFLAGSSKRKFTKKEEDRTVIDAYELLKEDIVMNNMEAVKKYNEYAEKSGFGCLIPGNRLRTGINIPDSVKELYEKPCMDREF